MATEPAPKRKRPKAAATARVVATGVTATATFGLMAVLGWSTPPESPPAAPPPPLPEAGPVAPVVVAPVSSPIPPPPAAVAPPQPVTTSGAS